MRVSSASIILLLGDAVAFVPWSSLRSRQRMSPHAPPSLTRTLADSGLEAAAAKQSNKPLEFPTPKVTSKTPISMDNNAKSRTIMEARYCLLELKTAAERARDYLCFLTQVADVMTDFLREETAPLQRIQNKIQDWAIPTAVPIDNVQVAAVYLVNIEKATASATEYLEYLQEQEERASAFLYKAEQDFAATSSSSSSSTTCSASSRQAKQQSIPQTSFQDLEETARAAKDYLGRLQTITRVVHESLVDNPSSVQGMEDFTTPSLPIGLVGRMQGFMAPSPQEACLATTQELTHRIARVNGNDSDTSAARTTALDIVSPPRARALQVYETAVGKSVQSAKRASFGNGNTGSAADSYLESLSMSSSSGASVATTTASPGTTSSSSSRNGYLDSLTNPAFQWQLASTSNRMSWTQAFGAQQSMTPGEVFCFMAEQYVLLVKGRLPYAKKVMMNGFNDEFETWDRYIEKELGVTPEVRQKIANLKGPSPRDIVRVLLDNQNKKAKPSYIDRMASMVNGEGDGPHQSSTSNKSAVLPTMPKRGKNKKAKSSYADRFASIVRNSSGITGGKNPMPTSYLDELSRSKVRSPTTNGKKKTASISYLDEMTTPQSPVDWSQASNGKQRPSSSAPRANKGSPRKPASKADYADRLASIVNDSIPPNAAPPFEELPSSTFRPPPSNRKQKASSPPFLDDLTSPPREPMDWSGVNGRAPSPSPSPSPVRSSSSLPSAFPPDMDFGERLARIVNGPPSAERTTPTTNPFSDFDQLPSSTPRRPPTGSSNANSASSYLDEMTTPRNPIDWSQANGGQSSSFGAPSFQSSPSQPVIPPEKLPFVAEQYVLLVKGRLPYAKVVLMNSLNDKFGNWDQYLEQQLRVTPELKRQIANMAGSPPEIAASLIATVGHEESGKQQSRVTQMMGFVESRARFRPTNGVPQSSRTNPDDASPPIEKRQSDRRNRKRGYMDTTGNPGDWQPLRGQEAVSYGNDVGFPPGGSHNDVIGYPAANDASGPSGWDARYASESPGINGFGSNAADTKDLRGKESMSYYGFSSNWPPVPPRNDGSQSDYIDAYEDTTWAPSGDGNSAGNWRQEMGPASDSSERDRGGAENTTGRSSASAVPGMDPTSNSNSPGFSGFSEVWPPVMRSNDASESIVTDDVSDANGVSDLLDRKSNGYRSGAKRSSVPPVEEKGDLPPSEPGHGTTMDEWSEPEETTMGSPESEKSTVNGSVAPRPKAKLDPTTSSQQSSSKAEIPERAAPSVTPPTTTPPAKTATTVDWSNSDDNRNEESISVGSTVPLPVPTAPPPKAAPNVSEGPGTTGTTTDASAVTSTPSAAPVTVTLTLEWTKTHKTEKDSPPSGTWTVDGNVARPTTASKTSKKASTTVELPKTDETTVPQSGTSTANGTIAEKTDTGVTSTVNEPTSAESNTNECPESVISTSNTLDQRPSAASLKKKEVAPDKVSETVLPDIDTTRRDAATDLSQTPKPNDPTVDWSGASGMSSTSSSTREAQRPSSSGLEKERQRPKDFSLDDDVEQFFFVDVAEGKESLSTTRRRPVLGDKYRDQVKSVADKQGVLHDGFGIATTEMWIGRIAMFFIVVGLAIEQMTGATFPVQLGHVYDIYKQGVDELLVPREELARSPAAIRIEKAMQDSVSPRPAPQVLDPFNSLPEKTPDISTQQAAKEEARSSQRGPSVETTMELTGKDATEEAMTEGSLNQAMEGDVTESATHAVGKEGAMLTSPHEAEPSKTSATVELPKTDGASAHQSGTKTVDERTTWSRSNSKPPSHSVEPIEITKSVLPDSSTSTVVQTGRSPVSGSGRPSQSEQPNEASAQSAVSMVDQTMRSPGPTVADEKSGMSTAGEGNLTPLSPPPSDATKSDASTTNAVPEEVDLRTIKGHVVIPPSSGTTLDATAPQAATPGLQADSSPAKVSESKRPDTEDSPLRSGVSMGLSEASQASSPSSAGQTRTESSIEGSQQGVTKIADDKVVQNQNAPPPTDESQQTPFEHGNGGE